MERLGLATLLWNGTMCRRTYDYGVSNEAGGRSGHCGGLMVLRVRVQGSRRLTDMGKNTVV